MNYIQIQSPNNNNKKKFIPMNESPNISWNISWIFPSYTKLLLTSCDCFFAVCWAAYFITSISAIFIPITLPVITYALIIVVAFEFLLSTFKCWERNKTKGNLITWIYHFLPQVISWHFHLVSFVGECNNLSNVPSTKYQYIH